MAKTYEARYGGEDLDLREVLNEMSMAAHDLKKKMRDDAVNALDWGTPNEVSVIAKNRETLMRTVIDPIEKLRIAITEVGDED